MQKATVMSRLQVSEVHLRQLTFRKVQKAFFDFGISHSLMHQQRVVLKASRGLSQRILTAILTNKKQVYSIPLVK